MTKENKHTGLPWTTLHKFETCENHPLYEGHKPHGFILGGDTGEAVIGRFNDYEDAAVAFRAVNSHEKLVKALETVHLHIRTGASIHADADLQRDIERALNEARNG